MTSMPIIDDHMVDLFRRTRKRRASYRPAQGGRAVAGAQRVVPQADIFCPRVGERCRHPNGALGWCHPGNKCKQDVFPGYELPPPSSFFF